MTATTSAAVPPIENHRHWVDRRAQLIALGCGPVMVVGFLLGGLVIGHFVPPFVHPSDSAQKVARLYSQHADRIRWGAMISMISLALLAPWGMAIAAYTRRIEHRPTLAYTQIACVAISVTIVEFMCMFWAIAAFRPGDMDPNTVRALSDIAYFLLIWPYFPFSIWVATIGLAVFLAPADDPLYPRWFGYFSFWNAISFLPAGFMPFFHHGPIAWTGLLALYVPLSMFFTWIILITILTTKSVRKEAIN
jgi:hypothetical protein